MFCKFCGEKIEDNAIFCSKCGAKLTSEEKTNVVSSEIIDTTNSLNENEKPIKKKSDKILNIIQKVVFGCLIAGIVGITLFLGIVLVGLFAYGRVYLFDGYDFTKVLSIISIVLMLIGVCGIITKAILYFIFKVETFPRSIIKRILVIVLAVACLGFSIWGFVDCSNSSNYDSGYNSSSGGSIGDYDNTVSEYLGLSLSVTKIETSGNYTYVYCSVKNVSHLYGNATMYRYIKVKAVFKDRYGSTLDTDWTYAIDSTWLNSGETKTFYYMVRNTLVKSAELFIIE